jgi:hypothetical protein
LVETNMQPTQATLEEYCGFISNPQGEGIWSMRIELPETQASRLHSFLNIEGQLQNRARGNYYLYPGKVPFYAYEDRFPILLPRLFAYLRAAIPQKERAALPNLTLQEDSRTSRPSFFKQRRSYRILGDILQPPTRLSTAKRRRLRKAVEIYQQHFVRCMILPVPEEIAKLDVVCPNPLTYFQIAEEPPALRISSPCENTLQQMREILGAIIQDTIDIELTKVFSPENALMGMYLPILQLIPFNSIIKDKTSAVNVRQALDEAREERFVHAIRAIGIAAEELLVGIYETYLREKAPEAPLGNIINELSVRIQEIVQGEKASREGSLGAVRKQIGKAIEAEKKAANNQSFLLLAEQLQQNIIPMLESFKQAIDENSSLNLRASKINLFPPNVKRCLSELVNLRNRVSHRVERVVSVASVGYVDTAIALRDFIVVAKWWESERKELNYKSTPRVMIQETVKRSRSQDKEPERTA